MGIVYATQADRNLYGIPAVALGSLTSSQIDAALASASAVIDTYFRGRYSLPLVAWGVEVRRCCVFLADYELLATRGYNPAAGSDSNVLARYNEMIGAPDVEGWLPRVQRRAAHPDVTETSQDVTRQRPRVFTSSVVDVATGACARNRGW